MERQFSSDDERIRFGVHLDPHEKRKTSKQGSKEFDQEKVSMAPFHNCYQKFPDPGYTT